MPRQEITSREKDHDWSPQKAKKKKKRRQNVGGIIIGRALLNEKTVGDRSKKIKVSQMPRREDMVTEEHPRRKGMSERR